MPTLKQRIRFLRQAGAGYTWMLLLRKFGRKRARRRHGDRDFVVPLDSPGGVRLMRRGERWMVPLLGKLLPMFPGTFLDAGASAGHTLLQLRAAEDERPWLGFEPAPANCKTIRALIRANDLRHTKLIEAGLSDHAGEAVLRGVSPTDGASTMIPELHGDDHPDLVCESTVRLVDAAALAKTELAGRVGVVKIDVEGMELEVVRGLREVLRRDRPPMICEILPVPDEDTPRGRFLRGRGDALTDELNELDYRLVRIGSQGGFEDVEAPRHDVNSHEANYLLIPAERYEEVRAKL